MRILCCSDSHGNVDAIQKMVSDVQKRNIVIDAIIFAGDFTKGIMLPGQQQQFDETLRLLSSINEKIYYVLGNRDVNVMPSTSIMPDGNITIKPRYTGLRPSDKYGIYLGCDYEKSNDIGSKYEIRDGLYITGNRSLIDKDTIYVEHSPYGKSDRSQYNDIPNVISNNALLHIAGHTHKGLFVKNYLNTNFLYRDDSHGANSMLGDYFLVDISESRNISVLHCPIGNIVETDYHFDGFNGRYYSKYNRSFMINLKISNNF